MNPTYSFLPSFLASFLLPSFLPSSLSFSSSSSFFLYVSLLFYFNNHFFFLSLLYYLLLLLFYFIFFFSSFRQMMISIASSGRCRFSPCLSLAVDALANSAHSPPPRCPRTQSCTYAIKLQRCGELRLMHPLVANQFLRRLGRCLAVGFVTFLFYLFCFSS